MDIVQSWSRLKDLPGGRALFNLLMGRMIPYTGSIHPEVVKLEPGHTIVRMKDRRKLRNHLQSIHAAALMNLLEVTSGLTFVAKMPKGLKGIVIRFSVDYRKKARGILTAESRYLGEIPMVEASHEVEAEIRDEAGDVVATGRATWRTRVG